MTKLFQYWDADPPAIVVEWMAGVERRNRDFAYRRLDRAAAYDYISRSHGLREAEAFSKCAVPAMQADFARLCFLDAEGGLYVDADHVSVAPIAPMVADADGMLIPYWLLTLCTGVLFAREAGNAFVRACLTLALDNIETRRFESVLFTTGPNVLNAVRYVVDAESRAGLDYFFAQAPSSKADWARSIERAFELIEPTADLRDAWSHVTLMPVERKTTWLQAPRPAYKDEPSHWENWSATIYR